MGCRILESKDGSAVLYCSSTMWAFGPVMESVQEAEAFVKWLRVDPRSFIDSSGLEKKYYDFRTLNAKQKHEAGLCETLGIENECTECVKKYAEEVAA